MCEISSTKKWKSSIKTPNRNPRADACDDHTEEFNREFKHQIKPSRIKISELEGKLLKLSSKKGKKKKE